uniref:thyroglobulin-like n=1 Tax=Oncorhynchus gorbuscha TaxID=8017 RepID=UPI001EAEA7E7
CAFQVQTCLYIVLTLKKDRVTTKGFLGNAGADMFQNLSCSLKVNGADRQNVTVIRKKGSDECTQNTCCDGFILNQNVLSGVRQTGMSGLAKANRICGAGVTYNKLQKQFIFNFGGQDFNITDTALPTSSKNKTDYQATIIGFQGIYLWKESDMTTRPKTSPACSSVLPQQAPRVVLSDAVKETFVTLDSSAVVVDSERDIPSLHYWIFKHQFSAQEAQLWCLKRCEEEELCHLADVRDESSVYFTCALYPDTQVCGAYDKPLRQACSPVLPQQPHTAHTKK